MLAFIVLGLTAVFIQTQRAFKTGIKQSDVTDAGRTIMGMISDDLRQVADAQNEGVTNLYWSWAGSNQFAQGSGDHDSGGNTIYYRTNQQDEIYILVHTNTTWMGIGYAVSNSGPQPGVGTLYRYMVFTNAPQITNDLFWPFYSNINFQNFGTNWHQVADGVLHLKLRAFDTNGNEPWVENAPPYGPASGGDYNPNGGYYSYPQYSNFANPMIVSNTLPSSLELELAILEPDALAHAQALVVNPLARGTYLSNSAAKVDVFRQRITISPANR